MGTLSQSWKLVIPITLSSFIIVVRDKNNLKKKVFEEFQQKSHLSLAF